MKTKLETAKVVIAEHYREADCGIFSSRNVVGDTMSTIYNEDGLTIDICYKYSYFEVFGLSDEDFAELKGFYNSL
jgi:hypothetical protein